MTTENGFKNIIGFLPEEIEKEFTLEKKFIAKQIFLWIAKGVFCFDEMTNLSKATRERLALSATVGTSCVEKILRDSDGTVKLQIKLHDGNFIETVLLIDKNGRKTACVSSQAGCPLACAFCKTGSLGFARNLEAGEIVEQFLFLEKECGKLDNIVFMGMGEPLLNLDNVLKAITILTHKDGRALSHRRITISTAGIVEGIYKLANYTPAVRLAFSLTCADEVLRKKLMPVAEKNSLIDIQRALDFYIEKTKRRVTLEVAMIGQMNTNVAHAKKIADFVHGIKNENVHINLIPWNKTPEIDLQEPTEQEVKSFLRELEKQKLNITVRTRRGKEIGGACGQLGIVASNATMTRTCTELYTAMTL